MNGNAPPSLAVRDGPEDAWRKWTTGFSAQSEHAKETQIHTRSTSGFLQLSCFSTASMHLLADMPLSAGKMNTVLVSCPSHCETNAKVVQLQEHIGGKGIWSTTNNAYTDYSFVCLAAIERTQVDGGLFLLSLHADMSDDPAERRFMIKKTAHPFHLDADKDGTISENEARAGSVLFDGMGGFDESIHELGLLDLMTAEMAIQMDTNRDLILTQQEQLAWVSDLLDREHRRRLNLALQRTEEL
jgi:hypothetical protein